MVSENQKQMINSNTDKKNKRPEPKNMNAVSGAMPVRIKFSKNGDLIYISHLDLNRTMQRIIIRAGIPIWYSEGFNPQPKLVFSSPLSIGCASDCEYMDIKLVKEIDFQEALKRLNECAPEGLVFHEMYAQKSKFTEIAFAEYEIVISDSGDSEKSELAQKINELFSKPVYLMKRSKSGENETDICRFINRISAVSEENLIKISCVLCADSANYLNPEYIVTALKNKFGILHGDIIKEWYTITRKNLLKSDGETSFI